MASCSVSSGPATAAADAIEADVTQALGRVRDFIEPRLEAALTFSAEAAPRLADSMRYAVLAPGKRLRPALVLWAAQACGPRDTAWETAAPAAVE